MIDAYALSAPGAPAVIRIDSDPTLRPFTLGKNDASDACEKLFAGTTTVDVPRVLPLPSTSVSDAPTGSLLRFTRPMFVRNEVSDSMPVRKSDCCSWPSLTCGTAWPYVPTLPVVKVRL